MMTGAAGDIPEACNGSGSDEGNRDGLLRLAAARAALDPERRSWRHDILLSAVIETISLYGPQPVDRLYEHVCRIWATGALSRTAVEAALGTASDAGLLQSSPNLLSDKITWDLTDATRQEASQDRGWVRAIMGDFAQELRRRIRDEADIDLPERRTEGLAQSIFGALARGAQGTFEFARGAMSASQLRPAQFDVAAARDYLTTNVNPSDLAEAMKDQLVSILNPDDGFGNQVLRLLVVGNILQGVLSGRDLAANLDMGVLRLALDTSTLIHLTSEDTPEHKLLVDFLERCRRAGAQVVVTEHTLGEWERLWGAAEGEARHVDVSEVRRLGEGYALAGNPITREYVRHLVHDETGNWTRFSIGRRDPRPFLQQRGVIIREHGNHHEDDRTFAAQIRSRLHELSGDERIRGDRTRAAADDDANTAAMLRRWREAQPTEPPIAWFVAYDYLTDRAYRETTGSAYPLCLPLGAALLLLASLAGDDEASVAFLVDTLSSAAARDSFLTVAASYGLEEIRELAAKMSPDASLSAADATIALQLSFEAMLKDAKQMGSEEARRHLATRAVQLRGARHYERADRTMQTARKQVEAAAARESDVRREAEAKGRAAAQPAIDEVEDRLRRAKRAAALIVAAVVAASVLALLFVVGVLPPVGALISGVVILAASGHGYGWVRDLDRPAGALVADLVVMAAGIGLGFMPLLFE